MMYENLLNKSTSCSQLCGSMLLRLDVILLHFSMSYICCLKRRNIVNLLMISEPTCYSSSNHRWWPCFCCWACHLLRQWDVVWEIFNADCFSPDKCRDWSSARSEGGTLRSSAENEACRAPRTGTHCCVLSNGYLLFCRSKCFLILLLLSFYKRMLKY